MCASSCRQTENTRMVIKIMGTSHYSEIPLVRNPICPKSHSQITLWVKETILFHLKYTKLYFKWKRIVSFTQRVI